MIVTDEGAQWLGMVPPAYVSIPPRLGTYGDIVADFAADYGRPPSPEQRIALDVMCSFGEGGRPAALTAVVIGPRQSTGKTGGIALPMALADLWVFNDPDQRDLVIWTAHRFPTAQETFTDVKQLIAGSAMLSRRVKRFSEENGDEGVDLMDGSRLRFKARSEGSGAGFSGRRVFYDEAWKLSAESISASLPTMTTRPEAQAVYMSSAPHEDSSALRVLGQRLRRGDPDLAGVEWCAPGSWDDPGCRLGDACSHLVGTPGCALDDMERVKLANPELDRRVTRSYIRAERKDMLPEKYARERLGWWDLAADGDQPIDPADWQANAVKLGERPAGRPAFLVDVAYGNKSAAVAAATRLDHDRVVAGQVEALRSVRKGTPYVELADYERGTKWLVGRCREIAERYPTGVWGGFTAGTALGAHVPAITAEWTCGADPLRPGSEVCARHLAAGGGRHAIELQELTAADMAKACGMLDDLTPDGMVHDDNAHLASALVGAGRADKGEGAWTFARRKSTTDLCPLFAVAGALLLLATMPAAAPVPMFAYAGDDPFDDE